MKSLCLCSGILALCTPAVRSFGIPSSSIVSSSSSVPLNPIRTVASPRTSPTADSPRLGMASQPGDGSDDAVAILPSWSLTPAAADRAADAALTLARSNGWAVTVCISDGGGVPLVARRDDGGGGGGGPPAFAASYEIAVGKARSAALFGRPTSGLEGAANVKRTSDGGGSEGRTALLSAPFIIMGGGVPVKADNGVVVGAVGVSGVKPDQDEMVAQAAVEALEGMLPALPSNPISKL